MESYTLVAWLPGTENVALRTSSDRVGYWNPDVGFVEQFGAFIEAAVYKYGYRKLPEEAVTLGELPAIVEKLNENNR